MRIKTTEERNQLETQREADGGFSLQDNVPIQTAKVAVAEATNCVALNCLPQPLTQQT